MLLTPQQEQVLALISGGSTISDAAQSAGIHRNSIHHWVSSAPAFRLALAPEAKALYWREQAEQLAVAALDIIRPLMADHLASASVRLKPPSPSSSWPSLRRRNCGALRAVKTRPMPGSINRCTILHNPVPRCPRLRPRSLPSPSPMPGNRPRNRFHRDGHKIGRNDLCPCGRGRKFKRCCLEKTTSTLPPQTAAARPARGSDR